MSHPLDAGEEALVAAGEDVRAAATSRRTKHSEDTVGAMIGRIETPITSMKAKMESRGMDEWEMIKKELSDRRDREKKTFSCSQRSSNFSVRYGTNKRRSERK